jgi:hypothetical protein
MATQYEINKAEENIANIKTDIAVYQAVIDDPARSAVSKQVAQTNLGRYNAKLATAQASLEKLQAQGDPIKDAPADQPPATPPAQTPAAVEQKTTTDPAISTAQQQAQANADTPLSAPTQVSVKSEPSIKEIQADAGTSSPNDQQVPVSDAVAKTPAQIETEAKAIQPVDPKTLEGYGVQATVDKTTTEGFGVQAAIDPTTLEGYGVKEIGATSASKVYPDGFGGYENGQGERVDANGVPILPASAPAQTTSVTPKSVPQKTTIGQDWRVRLSLAPGANYLYKQEPLDFNDILYPLRYTEGVIFPYLPTINVSYKANYQNVDIVHTNYKNWFYQNSSVDEITIVGDFTAQDNVEAKYMLAVIHFFKSVTKMFYGQDVDPRGGTPPPLCYLTGLGSYQFNNHPLVIGSFTYNLPNDVDYIRTEEVNSFSSGGITNIVKNSPPKSNGIIGNALSKFRLGGAKLNKGAVPKQPNFSSITKPGSGVTYVPTKLSIQITAYPVVTRQDISNRFKLNGKDGYSSGKLTKDGIW